MAFVDSSRELVFEYWFEPEFLGEQWGIGVYDLDGNGYLDFYANHHGQKTGEIIMNFASGSQENIFYEIRGDLHGITFFDVDQDGDADLLQAQGGRSGTASDLDDPGLWNEILLNDNGTLSLENRADKFGLEYSLGRRTLLIPINFDGDLAVYMGVYNNRPDGSYSGDFFLRDSTGYYNLNFPVGAGVSGDIAKGVHFEKDRFVDVINLDHYERELKVYENRGSGFGEPVVLSASRVQVTDVVTGDFDGDLEAEILFGRAGRRDALFRKDAAGNWEDVSEASTTEWINTSSILIPGDFDNDGDLDYAALKREMEVDGVEVVLYLNDGDGIFKVGSRFFDPEIEGRSDHMISGDFNRDGALDLLITTSAIGGGEEGRDGVYVYLEGVPTRNNWLSIELRGTVSETGGLGARVYVTTEDGKVRVLEQDSGAHYAATNSTDLHFGLADNERADVRIVWPDGFAQTIERVAANQHVVLSEERGSEYAQVLNGTSGDDELIGSGAADRISGDGGDDRLKGRGGDDGLYGGKGDDKLYGGDGDDIVSGGRGGDAIRGGDDADTFRFTKPLHTKTGDRRDVIKDFETSVDILNLRKMDANDVKSGNQTFDFLGGDAFDRKPGELRFSNTIVEGDVDGDGSADFEIELREVAALRVADVLL